MHAIYDVIIIGAGITGITLSKTLRGKGLSNFLVLEAEDAPGGLCRTTTVAGHHLDTGGGHFLCSKYPEIMDLIFEHIPESAFNRFPRVSKIRIEDTLVDFPLEANLWQLPVDKQAEYLIATIQNGEALQQPAPTSYEDWMRWKLGDAITTNYMIPYNCKLWGVSPSAMDIDWLHKIPRVDLHEIVKLCLERRLDTTLYPSHAQFYYPKKGGFQTIFDALCKDELPYIRTSAPVTSLQWDDRKSVWTVNGTLQCRSIINTAPWPDLQKALAAPAALDDCFERLQYNRLAVSLYETAYAHDMHWTYCPDLDLPYHREFFISNFARDSAPNGLYTETNLKRYDAGYALPHAKHLYTYTTQAAYPIPLIGNARAIKAILDYYRARRLYGIGRWGEWEYLNADVSMKRAVDFCCDLNWLPA